MTAKQKRQNKGSKKHHRVHSNGCKQHMMQTGIQSPPCRSTRGCRHLNPKLTRISTQQSPEQVQHLACKPVQKRKKKKTGKSTNVQHAKLKHALKKFAPVAADALCWRKTCLVTRHNGAPAGRCVNSMCIQVTRINPDQNLKVLYDTHFQILISYSSVAASHN